MNTQVDRAFEKATKNIDTFLRASPEGAYLSQITGSLMISSDLARRALNQLNAVFENGMYVLPADQEPVKVAAVVEEPKPEPVTTLAPVEAPVAVKKFSKMKEAEDKVLLLLTSNPDGFTREELQAQANLNSGRVYNAIHAIRLHTAVYNNLVGGKMVYSLTEIEATAEQVNVAPSPVKPVGDEVQPEIVQEVKPLVGFHRCAPLNGKALPPVDEDAYLQATSALEIESEADFKCSMCWSDGTAKIEIENITCPFLAEAVLDYIQQHQGSAA